MRSVRSSVGRSGAAAAGDHDDARDCGQRCEADEHSDDGAAVTLIRHFWSDSRVDGRLDRLLDAQRRVVEAEIRYFQARSEYAIALKNVHLEKGSLMAYNDLEIFDGESPVIRETVEVASTDALKPPSPETVAPADATDNVAPAYE